MERLIENKDVAGVKEMMEDMEGREMRQFEDELRDLGITSKYILGLNALNIHIYTHMHTHSSRKARRFW